ncbi:retrovirus-related pol polyprotein from transposon TNT 1-94 [Tanacetum coccineum]|uniref:Retrovirus-related pol polyprotein from transposon TNT 1-94 n=1 Tax=Tanacetum coccineum TaxID=301880 RepID=A0ABQ5CKN4_9ASTR
MTTLADKSLLSGGDNKPPMLEKHLYDSWKSRMELYMMNRPHGRMILASVEKGPLVWPTITVDGVTRPKEYTELTPAETIQADCDIKAINIILQGLPTEIYALVSQHRVAKDIWEKIRLLMQGTSLTKQEREFNTKFLNTLPAEWSKFVTDVKLVKDLHTTNVDQIHAHLKQHERHANEVRFIHERSSDPLAIVASIKREFSVARTLQQNGVAERKNRTLIEAARTMLADSLLPIPIWEEAVNTACYVNVDAGTQDSYVAGSSGKDKGPTQEYILLPLQPHRTRIPIEDVAPAAHEKPSKSSPKDNDIQDSEDVIDKEGQHQMPEDEQVLHDELEKMEYCISKEASSAKQDNKLSTDRSSVSTDRPFVSTDRSSVSTVDIPYVSAASTFTGENAGESSFVFLGGKIPIDASTLPNADLPIDPNMPDLEETSNTLLNDGIFNGAYDDD